MARIRKDPENNTRPQQIGWNVGLYIRLSRDDGNDISASVVNQEKILNDEISNFFKNEPYKVIDTYKDDGTSGTTDIERRDFQRMVGDVKSGRINCIMVKNLSRAFRNSANQGRFLEEFIPLYNTRFISLYEPRLDTFLQPEVVHSLEVSITGFMNEQYAYKSSLDIRRTLKHKRENGEFIGAFAPYGYAKDPEDKNALIIDEDAAQTVRDIFSWFVTDGMSKAGIAKRLNELGIPNPTAYKRSRGFRYKNPHATANDGLWNPTTVTRMLQDPLYIGVMQQGKQKVTNYKVHTRVAVSESDWFVVENALPPTVSRETFQAAQMLHKQDTRTAPGKSEVYLFSGLVRCADCDKGMGRHSSKGLVYYTCRTYTQKSKERCTKHSIRLDTLENSVLVAIQTQIEMAVSLSEKIEEINNAPVVQTQSARLNGLLSQQTKELEKVSKLSDGLYMDWKSGDITHDQYRRMKVDFDEKAEQLRKSIDHIKDECDTIAQGITAQDPYLTAFLKYRNVESLSRGLLVELVNTVYVHEDGKLKIKFNFGDNYRRIVEFIENNQKELYVIGGKAAS